MDVDDYFIHTDLKPGDETEVSGDYYLSGKITRVVKREDGIVVSLLEATVDFPIRTSRENLRKIRGDKGFIRGFLSRIREWIFGKRELERGEIVEFTSEPFKGERVRVLGPSNWFIVKSVPVQEKVLIDDLEKLD
ncbi:hypothetical protein AKJ53_01140 [candidate division MSBL1 archaeon SCGC-AAA382F02]|uniref:Uncharacterized protein n=1 Tax=candidate division MSBL1 archaeon SCGC-AAA382F02 TaxID=1698282 RepID=A0A133VIA7_9EURY|nr:hypothetical protein AKJ53_01140 [candidate division MSBL1 archaeon SCGC-AAA382F02]